VQLGDQNIAFIGPGIPSSLCGEICFFVERRFLLGLFLQPHIPDAISKLGQDVVDKRGNETKEKNKPTV